MILRCTARLRRLLPGGELALVDTPPAEDDWYANLLWIDRRKCLLLAHAGTLLPVFHAHVRTSQLKSLGPFITGLVADALADEGLPADTLGILNPADVRVAPTASRSLLGHLNEMAFTCQCEIEAAGGLAMTDIVALNHRLRRGLHNRNGYVVPLELAAKRAAVERA